MQYYVWFSQIWSHINADSYKKLGNNLSFKNYKPHNGLCQYSYCSPNPYSYTTCRQCYRPESNFQELAQRILFVVIPIVLQHLLASSLKVEIDDFSIRVFHYKVTVLLENINLWDDLQYIWVLYCCCLEYPQLFKLESIDLRILK